MRLDADIDNLIGEIIEQDDVDEVRNQIALFCYNYKIMPGSEEFDYIMEYIWFHFFNTNSNKIIHKIRDLIDEYE